MADKTTDNADPHPLEDADLAKVSGGEVPERFMTYLELLPSHEQQSCLAALDDPDSSSGEHTFVARLMTTLQRYKFRDEYRDVWNYESNHKW